MGNQSKPPALETHTIGYILIEFDKHGRATFNVNIGEVRRSMFVKAFDLLHDYLMAGVALDIRKDDLMEYAKQVTITGGIPIV